MSPDPAVPVPRAGQLDSAIQAARQAGRIIKDSFRHGHNVKAKGRSNLVTEVDLAAEKSIITALSKDFPDIPFVSEEADSALIKSGWSWIVDPLDGTTNYVYGVPFFCVNIALVYDTLPVAAITYDPIHDELFTAEAGHGARLNEEPISVSIRSALDSAVVGSDVGYHFGRGQETLALTKDLRESVLCLRVLGSAALGLAYVACGRYDIYFHRYLYPWDIAAGLLLVREAGGDVHNWDWADAGVADKQIIATNHKLNGPFRDAIKSSR